MGENETQPTQKEVAAEEIVTDEKTMEDIRKMFFLREGETVTDITDKMVIDKFRDSFNKFRADIAEIYYSEIQEAAHLAPREVELDEETKEMLGRLEAITSNAIERGSGLGPVPEIKSLLERYLRLLGIYANYADTWLRFFHIFVEKSKATPHQEGPSQIETMQENFAQIRETTEEFRREASGHIKDAEKRIKYLEDDLNRHKQTKTSYCHKGTARRDDGGKFTKVDTRPPASKKPKGKKVRK